MLGGMKWICSVRSLEMYSKCEECLHARVGPGELCYCRQGRWEERVLKNVKKMRVLCEHYEMADYEHAV